MIQGFCWHLMLKSSGVVSPRQSSIFTMRIGAMFIAHTPLQVASNYHLLAIVASRALLVFLNQVSCAFLADIVVITVLRRG